MLNILTEEEKSVLRDLDAANGRTKHAVVSKLSDTPEKLHPHMSEYIRETRGLTLATLSIYLVPAKASIISKSIDLSVLQNITLLSVGSQTSLWNHLEKENKVKPLAIRKIHTDNVTLPFLNLVSQLQNLEELYMLERLAKRGEVAVKTTVTMDQIRKAVLKKHASTLKVLMVRNDATHEWDFNVKAVMLLCQRAVKLEELTATFVSKAFVSLPLL